MSTPTKLRFPSAAARENYYKNRKKILKRDDICAICGGYVDKTLEVYHPMSAEIDHIQPLSKGGDPSAIENLQLVHRKCNLKKSNKTPEAIEKETVKGVDPEGWVTW